VLGDGGIEGEIEVNGSLLMLYGDLRAMVHSAVHATQLKHFGAVRKVCMEGTLRMGLHVV